MWYCQPSSKEQRKNLYPLYFQSASLQTVSKDKIKLNWPTLKSSISTGLTGNKSSRSNVSTFIDSKCNLNKGRKQHQKLLFGVWKTSPL